KVTQTLIGRERASGSPARPGGKGSVGPVSGRWGRVNPGRIPGGPGAEPLMRPVERAIPPLAKKGYRLYPGVNTGRQHHWAEGRAARCSGAGRPASGVLGRMQAADGQGALTVTWAHRVESWKPGQSVGSSGRGATLACHLQPAASSTESLGGATGPGVAPGFP